ncbi:MAG: tetratricopeptide repeat protein [Maritimibacter sp.]
MPNLRFLHHLALSAFLSVLAIPAQAQDDLAGPYLAALVADRAGDYQTLVEYGAKALEFDPTNAHLMEGILLAELGLGQIDEAVPLADRLSELDEEHQLAGLVHLANALKREDWQAASAALDKGQALGGLTDQLVRAWVAVGDGKMSRAIELFDTLSAGGNGGMVLLQKAMALAMVGDYEGAADLLGGGQQVLSLNQPGIVAYAQVLSQLDRNDDAADLLDQAFPGTEDPDLTEMRAALAAGDTLPFTAVAGPREALSQLFYEVGQSIRGKTDPGLVLLYARVAEYLDPDNIGARLLSALVLEDMENYPLAAEAYSQIGPGERAYVQARIGQATSLRQMEDVEAAIKVLKSAIETEPESPALQSALGDTLRFEQRYGEALDHYKAAIALYPEGKPASWSIYFARAICYERTGDWPAAEDDFRKALELSPDQPSVLNYLGYSYIVKGEHFDEAVDMIRRAVAGRPYDGFIRDSLGWAFFQLGNYDDAVVEMDRAVELKPLDPVLNDHLGDAYWAVGRKREAEFQWSRALSFITDETDLDELKPDRIRRKLEVGLDKVIEEEGGEPLAK